jgi:hypothetical protein
VVKDDYKKSAPRDELNREINFPGAQPFKIQSAR